MPFVSSDTGSDIQGGGAWDYLDNLVRGLDYLGNVTRTAEMAMIAPSMEKLGNVLKAIKIEHHTTPTELKDAITTKLGLGKVRMGADDGKFQWGDIVDYAVDFGVDLANDPLFWATGGMSRALKYTAKATRAARLGGKASRLSRELGVASKALSVAPMAIGAGVGAAAVPEDAPLAIKFLGAGAGAATIGLAPRHMAKVFQRYGLGEKAMAAKTLKHLSDVPEEQVKLWDKAGLDIMKKSAAEWLKFNQILKPAFGGMYGFSMANPDDSTSRKLFYGLLGASGVWGTMKIFPTVKKVAGTVASRSVDAYHEVARGFKEGKVPGHLGYSDADILKIATTQVNKKLRKKLPKRKLLTPAERVEFDKKRKTLINKEVESLRQSMPVSEAAITAQGAKDKGLGMFRILKGSEAAALKDISDADLIKFTMMEDKIKQKILSIRNARIKDKLKIDMKEVKNAPWEMQGQIDRITEVTNRYVRKNLESVMEADLDKELFKRTDKIRAHFHSILDQYNKEMGKNMVGLGFYIPDIHKAGDFRTIDQWMNFATKDKAGMHFATGSLYDDLGNRINPRNLQLRYALSDPEAAKKIATLDTWAKNKQSVLETMIDDVKARKVGKGATKESKALFNKQRKMDLDGLKAQIDDIGATTDLEASSILDNIKLKPEAIRAEWDEYYKRTIHGFMTKKERQAMQIMGAVKNMKPENKVLSGFEDFLGGYDTLHNFIKTLMLGGNISWLRTNYWDNLGKAYLEGGIQNMLKTGAFGANRKLQKDMLAIARNEFVPFKHADTQDFLKYGVLENPMFSMVGDPHADILKSYRGLSEVAKDFKKDPKRWVAKAKVYGGVLANKAGKPFKAQMDLLQEGRIPFTNKKIWMVSPFKLGTMMESTARATTYLNQVDHLVKNGFHDYLKDTILAGVKDKKKLKGMLDHYTKSMAADITKNAFFDYQKVHEFERTIMKRLIPFWTFYSRNLPYWFKGLFDLEKVGKIGNLDRIRRNVGERLTEEDRASIPPWIAGLAPRSLGDVDSGKRFMTQPYSSMYDAFRTSDPTRAFQTLTEKVSPLIKAPIEAALGHEFFSDTPLLPSQSRKGQKYAFSRGYKWKFVQDWLEKLGMEAGQFGIDEDISGNPIYTKDSIKILDKLMETLYPLGIVDKVAGTAGKYLKGEDTPDVIAAEIFTPIGINDIKHRQLKYYMKRHKVKQKLKKDVKRHYERNNP